MKPASSFLCLLFLSSCLFSQDNNKILADIQSKLAHRQISVSTILSDPRYMSLHSHTPFRQLIKKYATAGQLKIITDAEPGKKITVKGKIETAGNQPLRDALIYFYHTSDKGWYSDTAAHILQQQGDMGHARLFGYLKTDAHGGFEFETIQPRGYPGSDFPGHIHIMAWKNGEPVAGMRNEFQFDDDPRMTPERKARSQQEGNMIEKNSGAVNKPVYIYNIKLKQ